MPILEETTQKISWWRALLIAMYKEFEFATIWAIGEKLDG